jgi:predicted hydrocarbon binding protein
MTKQYDFERSWLEKFADCIEEAAGEDVSKQVIKGSEELSMRSDRTDVIDWSCTALEKLIDFVGESTAMEIMTGCACQYPRQDLQDIRLDYEELRDIDRSLQMLQEKFEHFLREVMQLDEEMIEEIVNRGWGLAGIRQGNTIVTTKIPKSGNLIEYMEERDPDLKRQLYCHCPRVRDALKTGRSIPTVYCYCGAGFYKSIWEEILGEPVQVEVLESVLQGDPVCKIAIKLPV